MKYNIERVIAVLSEKGKTKKLLTLTEWDGKPEQLDLRTWKQDENGELKPGSGVTLTNPEAEILCEIFYRVHVDR